MDAETTKLVADLRTALRTMSRDERRAAADRIESDAAEVARLRGLLGEALLAVRGNPYERSSLSRRIAAALSPTPDEEAPAVQAAMDAGEYEMADALMGPYGLDVAPTPAEPVEREAPCHGDAEWVTQCALIDYAEEQEADADDRLVGAEQCGPTEAEQLRNEAVELYKLAAVARSLIHADATPTPPVTPEAEGERFGCSFVQGTRFCSVHCEIHPEHAWMAGYTEFAWMIDGMPTPTWADGDEPRIGLAKYDPVLIRRVVGSWERSDDPRFAPTERPSPVPPSTPTADDEAGL